MQEPVNVPLKTVKVPELIAVPPGVVTAILPVFPLRGTAVVICVAELTVKFACPPPKVTLVACVNPVPWMTTCVPSGPLVGLKPEITGMTLNFLLLTLIPEGVVTVTDPVVPVTGTTAVMYASETTWKMVAEPVPNFTLVVPVNPLPRISIVCPALPEVLKSETNGCRPTFKLKNVP